MFKFLPFYHHPLLMKIDCDQPAYLLMQIKQRKLVVCHKKMIKIDLRRGVWQKNPSNLVVCRRRRCLRLMTDEMNEQRQIWLVDMKVKL